MRCLLCGCLIGLLGLSALAQAQPGECCGPAVSYVYTPSFWSRGVPANFNGTQWGRGIPNGFTPTSWGRAQLNMPVRNCAGMTAPIGNVVDANVDGLPAPHLINKEMPPKP